MSRPVIRIIEASSPLFLDSLRINNAAPPKSKKLEQALQHIVEEFYFGECRGDSNETYFKSADTYLFTVELPGQACDYYLTVMQQLPEGSVTGRLIEWDQRNELFNGGPVEVSLSAMYNVRDGELEPSNLKQQFNITGPELVIKDTLGQEAVVVQRLWHNGTFNAMERTVLGFGPGRVDTIFTLQSPI